MIKFCCDEQNNTLFLSDTFFIQAIRELFRVLDNLDPFTEYRVRVEALNMFSNAQNDRHGSPVSFRTAEGGER